MDAAELLGDWAVGDQVLTLGRSFDPRAFELRRTDRPGYVAGGWLAVEGRFATRMSEFAMPGHGGVGEPDFPTWLASAERVERGRDGILLRDARGRVTARLVRRGRPPPTTAGAAVLPPGLVPIDRSDLPGCWIPEGRTVSLRSRTPSLLIDADGTFRATDGANDLAGLWLTGTAGRLEGTGGETTLVGGSGLVDVPRWLARTCRAGLDGGILVLLDAAGAQVGRLERGHERAWPDHGARPWTADRARVGPVDALVGRWIPADGAGSGALKPPFVELAEDGTYTGSDGANGTSGTWRSGPDGTLEVSLGPSTRMAGPDMVPVPTWFATATRAQFEGDVLVLLDADGAEAGRLRRA